MSLNPFEQVAADQQNAYSKARDRGLEKRMAKLVVQSERDAPMVAKPSDKQMFEQSEQMKRYRHAMRLKREELVNGPNGPNITALLALLETLTPSSPNELVAHINDAQWLQQSDLNTRLDVLAIIGTAIMRFRVRAGLSPFDDSIHEPPTAFEQIRFILTGVGNSTMGSAA